MVSAIINLARSLGLTGVVEGTEKEERIAWLLGLGPIEAQGFLFSRPVPADRVPGTASDRFEVCGHSARARAAHAQGHGKERTGAVVGIEAED